MEALKSIGVKKAFKFLLYSIVEIILHIIILPQLRVLIMRVLGAEIGKDTIIGDVKFANLYHYGFLRIKIGNKCFIGDEVMLDARGGIELEDEVTISNRSVLVTHINVGYKDHPLQNIYPTKEEKVIIKKGCYIGTQALILPGITIGKFSVAAAGALVNKNVPTKTLVAGVPAKKIKKI